MELNELGDRIEGDVVLPGDATWDAARQPGTWRSTSGRSPSSTRSRRRCRRDRPLRSGARLRIAFNAGGHNAGPIDWSRDALLLKTERMDGIEIDVAARRARVEAGVLSRPLAVAAGEHGLAYLAGTSPNVGVVGYVLGGGLSWMIRSSDLPATASSRPRSSRPTGACPGRPRHGAGVVLGDPGRRRKRRGRDRDRARAIPDRRTLRGRPVLADRARRRDPQRLARLDRVGARRVRVPGSHAPVARRPLPARAPAGPIIRPGRDGLHRHAERRRSAGPAPARPWPGVRHGRDDALQRSQRREHGSRRPAAVLGRGDPADGPHPGGDRRHCRVIRWITAPPRRGSPPGRSRRDALGGPRCARRDRSTVRRLHVRTHAGSRGWPPSIATFRSCSARSARGTAAGDT